MNNTRRMDNGDLWRLPAALLAGPRFRNWRWKQDPNGKPGKRPWKPGVGFNFNGHAMSTAQTWEQVLGNVDQVTGVGIVTGRCSAFPITVLDIDYKDYLGDCREVNGQLLPECVAVLVEGAMEYGHAYAELSPSGMGVRLILAGTLPAGHPTRWNLASHERLSSGLSEAQLAAIGGEVYTTRRWLTLTGNHLHGEGQCTWTPDPERGQAWLRSFHRRFLETQITATRGEVHAIDLDGAESRYVSPEHAPAELRAAMRVPTFRRLWMGDLGALRGADRSHSAARWSLLGMLCGALNGVPQAVARAFLTSGLATSKVGTRRGDVTLLEQEVSRAVASWDGTVFPQPLRRARTPIPDAQVPVWTRAHREQLLFGRLGQARGTLAQRKAVRNLLADLLERMDAGEWYLHQGLCVVKLGGLTAVAERIGGQRTHIMARLQWLADAGFIARLDRDQQGSPVVSLALSGDGCRVLREGLDPDCPAMPSRPGVRRATDRQVQAARAPRTAAPVIPAHLNRARWTMWMIHAGHRDVPTISAWTGESVRAVGRHLKALRELGMISAEGQPLVTAQEYAGARQAELRERQARTRARRRQDSAEWNRYLQKSREREQGAERPPGHMDCAAD